ncbi:phage major capsid protein [Streptomyces sp. NPDC055013]
MANNTNLTDWTPIEWDSNVIQRVLKLSAVEANALPTPMGTATKRVLRAGAFTLTTGSSYTDDTSELDYVTLTARRFNGKTTLDEDTLNDVESIADAIGQRAYDWAVSYATQLDNACLAVTGAENGTTIPFTSVYKSVRTNGADVTSGYTADANYVSYNGTASAAYDKFSELLRLVEVGEYWDETNALVIANPAFRDVIRRTKDDNGMPVFVQGTNGTPDTLFNVPIAWSRGAKTSPTNTAAPAGNPLMIFCGDKRLLKLGVRSGPESLLKAADAADNTDDTALKLRSRRGFAVGNVNGFSVLEKVA